MQLTPNALRLLGRLHRHKSSFGVERLTYDCRDQFYPQEAAEVADELVVLGFFDTFLHGSQRRWARTEKPYTDKLRKKLAAYAQRHKGAQKILDRTRPLSAPRADIDPVMARWFGYPTATVFLTGRVHLMEGGGDD
jgi:hypothetical protein